MNKFTHKLMNYLPGLLKVLCGLLCFLFLNSIFLFSQNKTRNKLVNHELQTTNSHLIKGDKWQQNKSEWDIIKANTMPVIAKAFQNMYDKPYRQPLAAYGWEDGLHISRSGLNLYALYSPSDLLSWTMFIGKYSQLPFCRLFGDTSFVRTYAGTYGMDLKTNPFGCDNFLNIDILYSERKSITDTFKTWQLSGISRPGMIEGGPDALFSKSAPDKIDIFLFTGNNDIWMLRNTSANPSGINTAVRLPKPINPDSNEFNADNPFIERLNNSDTLVLIYEKYKYEFGNSADRNFYYSLSYDDGNSWIEPVKITTVNPSLGHIEHPHLYSDSKGQWYLYFSLDYDIYRAKQNIKNNWDSWVQPEMIISKGNAAGIGEPSVTENGDISFLVVYKRNITDTLDVYDCDPWFLPAKIINGTGVAAESKATEIKIFPNPAKNEISVSLNTTITGEKYTITDIYGRQVITGKVIGEMININVENLKAGIYILQMEDKCRQKFIKN